jgi:hypothetical protein
MKISRIFVGVFDAAARQAFSKIGKLEYQYARRQIERQADNNTLET